MKNRSTRESILDTLDESRSLSTHDLAMACAISEPVVRYHLRQLIRLGVIKEFHNPESGLKAGRKAPLFRRINPESNQNTNHLCSILLNLLVETSGGQLNERITTVAKQILTDHETLPFPDPGSLRKSIDWLNHHQYSAVWEAGKIGPIIQFSNCPFREIRSENAVLCAMDVQILKQLNGKPWELVQTMNWETLSGVCQFIVKPEAYR
jgi:predicted ArsR family transcriptional regulator